MFKKILIAVVVVVLAAGVYVFIQPDTFHVERSRTVNAPVDIVFGAVNDMKARANWYPWDRLDPKMVRTYSEKSVGKGASYEWSGNDKVGTGRQEILESVANTKIVDDLHFKTPFESKSKATFLFAKVDEKKTKVTWQLDGGDGLQTKVMNVFTDMDSAVGKDFEDGLRFLDEWASKEAKRAEKAALEAAAQAAAEKAAAEKAAAAVEAGADGE